MKIIVYYRVSTDKQGKSGLGLDAQATSVANFVRTLPEHSIIAEYTEIESGKRSDRAVLAQAIQHARSAGATLVIAKLDRLARNVHFVSGLMESKVDFICCDMPAANPLTIHILAAIAEDEAKRISQRTKEALAALKAKGIALGCHNPRVAAALEGKRGWKKASIAGVAARKKLQKERYGALVPVMQAMKAQGASNEAIALYLNQQGYVTSRGTPFNRKTVLRVLRRQTELSVA